MRYSNFTQEDETAFVDFTRSGAVAALIYTPNLIARGAVRRGGGHRRVPACPAFG